GPAVYTDGRVTLTDLRLAKEQQLSIRIAAPGYATLRHRVDRLPANRGGTIDLGTLRLQPVPVVRVFVTDAKTGAPVAGASVSLNLPMEDLREMMRRQLAEGEAGLPDLVGRGRGRSAAETDADGHCAV